MKKKTLIIIAIILILFKLITSYKDSARVRNGIEPKYTIKIISRNGRKGNGKGGIVKVFGGIAAVALSGLLCYGAYSYFTSPDKQNNRWA